jgi:hypothetical protein
LSGVTEVGPAGGVTFNGGIALSIKVVEAAIDTGVDNIVAGVAGLAWPGGGG